MSRPVVVPEEDSSGYFTCAALKVILCCACLKEAEGPSVCAVEKCTGKAVAAEKQCVLKKGVY